MSCLRRVRAAPFRRRVPHPGGADHDVSVTANDTPRFRRLLSQTRSGDALALLADTGSAERTAQKCNRFRNDRRTGGPMSPMFRSPRGDEVQ